MSGTVDSGDSYTGDDGKHHGSITYVLGVSFALIVLILIVSYISCKCRRSTSSPSPPDDEEHQPVKVSEGVNEDILMNFPLFVYSEGTVPHKGADTTADVDGSGCSVCLADYKPGNLVRLLPKCGHLFHSKCVDTWLKLHASCPVCRNSLLSGRAGQVPRMVPLPIQRS